MTLKTLGRRRRASLAALDIVHLFAPAPWDADPSFVERTEAKLEAVFSHLLPNAT